MLSDKLTYGGHKEVNSNLLTGEEDKMQYLEVLKSNKLHKDSKKIK